MRWTLPLLLGACAGPLPSEPVDEPPCSETVQPLRSGERTPWGTTPNTVRVVLDRTVATWSDTSSTELTVDLTWPSGFTALVWAEAAVEPELAPPLWCADRLQMPAGLRLTTADGRLDVDGAPVEVVGDLRAVGPLGDLELGFVGGVPAAALPGLVPDGLDPQAHELVVWVAWDRGDALTSRGEVRLAPVGAGELQAGARVAGWE